MAGADYWAIEKAIQTRLVAELTNVRVEVERELQWSEGREVIIYLDRRDATPEQSIANNTYYDQDVRYIIACQVFSLEMDTGQEARNELIHQVESALMKAPNDFGRNADVKYSWLAGGKFEHMQNGDSPGLYFWSEVILMVRTVSTI